MRRNVFKSAMLLCLVTACLSCEAPDKQTQQPQINKPVSIQRNDAVQQVRTTDTVAVKPSGAGLNVVLTSQAWEAYNRKDYKTAMELSDKCINEFLGRAIREQEQLETQKAPLPPTGAVSAQVKQAISERGLLNDVATCLYIKGRSLEATDRKDDAGKVYTATSKYTYARCWDTQGWFWSPAEGALDRLRMLK